jgi:hypothetical protein
MNLLATMGDAVGEGVASIVRVDLAREQAEPVFCWRPPEPLRAPGKGFTGITWTGAPGRSELLVCAHSALCRVDPASWRLTGVLHQPCMNDLHGVAVHDGRYLVTNTGLDRVDVFAPDGAFLGGWDLSPAWVAAERIGGCNPSRAGWSRALRPGWSEGPPPLDEEEFPPDYAPYVSRALPFPTRKIRDFVHPNHVVVVEGRPLVTRFLERSVQDLTSFSPVIHQTPGHPHDGLLHAGCYWLTCTNGLVVAYAVENGRVVDREVERIDVFARTGRTGWCRGLLVTDELIVVGLTQIRDGPRHRWCDRPFEGTETSVLALDRGSGRLRARVDLRRFGTEAKLFALLSEPGGRRVPGTDSHAEGGQ